jgi:hypothetical protein
MGIINDYSSEFRIVMIKLCKKNFHCILAKDFWNTTPEYYCLNNFLTKTPVINPESYRLKHPSYTTIKDTIVSFDIETYVVGDNENKLLIPFALGFF